MSQARDEFVSLGIPGIDKILHQGLLSGCTYLVRGGPGTGKTTLGMHFLTANQDTTGMFVTLGESAGQLKSNAKKLGFSTKAVHFLELIPPMAELGQEEPYTIFSTSEVEEKPLISKIIEAVEQYRPDRVFIDSLTQLHYLAPDSFQFRKQILSLFRYLSHNGATLLYTSEVGGTAGDDDLQFLSDGIIQLERRDSRRLLNIANLDP